MSNVGGTVSPYSLTNRKKRGPGYDPHNIQDQRLEPYNTIIQEPIQKEPYNVIQGLPPQPRTEDIFTCGGTDISFVGCTQNNCLPITGEDLNIIYRLISAECSGSTSLPCSLWNANTNCITNIISDIYCRANTFLCATPIKCFVDFFTGSTSGLCSGDLNPEKRDCAIKTFLQQSAFPPFPSNFVTETVSNAILGFSTRSIAYTYLPVFILFFLGIWIMVAVGWIGIGAGVLFSIALIVILYFFFVSYRSSFEVYVNNNITNIDAEVKTYRDAINNSLPKIPAAAVSALCTYTGNCYGCTGGLPECTGCTGGTGVTGESFVSYSRPCCGKKAVEKVYDE